MNNDKNINVNKAITDKNHYYFSSNLEALDEAINNLHSVGAIKLFLYLSKNQHNYNVNLNEENFCKWANESQEAFNDGFNELIENKYLVENFVNKNNYNFYDYNYLERADLKRDNNKKDNYKFNQVNVNIYN